MPWREQISNSLPEPDQPSLESIRQDIEDELADHLDCAYRRELLKTSNPEEARRRVVERFGDVCQVARQLWLQAWRNRLMAQKFALVVSGIAAACSLVACGLLIWFVQDAQRTSEELLRANREAFGQLMDRLSATETNEPLRSTGPTLDWNSLKAHVESADRGVADTVVQVKGNLLSPNEEVQLEQSTDAGGWADFGLVRPGQAYVMVTTPWGEYTSFQHTVRAGEESVITTLVPTGPPPAVPVDFRIEWPSRKRPDNLLLLCELKRASRQFGERYWHRENHVYLVIDPGGAVYQCQAFSLASRTSANPFPQKVDLKGPITRTDGLPQLESGRYRLQSLVLAQRPEQLPDPDAESSNLRIAAGMLDGQMLEVLPTTARRPYPELNRQTGPTFEISKDASSEQPDELVLSIDDAMIIDARATMHGFDTDTDSDLRSRMNDRLAIETFLKADRDFNEQLDSDELATVRLLGITPSGNDSQIQVPVTLDAFLELTQRTPISPRRVPR